MNYSDAIVGGALGAAVWWAVTHVLDSAEGEAEASAGDTTGPSSAPRWTPVWERTADARWVFVSWQRSPEAARALAESLTALGVFKAAGRSRFVVGAS